ncbi:MAG: hypothetical protein ACLU60_00650 [Faecalimonas sp.]
MTKIYNPISETENGKIPKKRPMDETKSGNGGRIPIRECRAFVAGEKNKETYGK